MFYRSSAASESECKRRIWRERERERERDEKLSKKKFKKGNQVKGRTGESEVKVDGECTV